jgi:hypothetical protein
MEFNADNRGNARCADWADALLQPQQFVSKCVPCGFDELLRYFEF